MQIASVDLGFFFPLPLMLFGIVCGVVVRRWALLAVVALFWVATAAPGIVHALTHGDGNPIVLFALWGLYLPVPLMVAVAAGILVGRRVRPLPARRHPERRRPPAGAPHAP
jgi:uncharacterized membrane protein